MSEKLTEKERLVLAVQLGTAELLLEIRDLLLEIRNRLGAQPKEETQRHHGYSNLDEYLDATDLSQEAVVKRLGFGHLLFEEPAAEDAP